MAPPRTCLRAHLSVVDVGIYLECPGGGPINMGYVQRYADGVLRALTVSGILDGHSKPPSSARAPTRVTGGGNLDRDMASVSRGGIFVHAVVRGDAVEAGQLLGTVLDVHGKHREEIRATAPGYVMAVKRRSTVRIGDMVVLVASET